VEEKATSRKTAKKKKKKEWASLRANVIIVASLVIYLTTALNKKIITKAQVEKVAINADNKAIFQEIVPRDQDHMVDLATMTRNVTHVDNMDIFQVTVLKEEIPKKETTDALTAESQAIVQTIVKIKDLKEAEEEEVDTVVVEEEEVEMEAAEKEDVSTVEKKDTFQENAQENKILLII